MNQPLHDDPVSIATYLRALAPALAENGRLGPNEARVLIWAADTIERLQPPSSAQGGHVLGGPWLVIAQFVDKGARDVAALKQKTTPGSARSQVRGNVDAMIRLGLLSFTPDGRLYITPRGRAQMPTTP